MGHKNWQPRKIQPGMFERDQPLHGRAFSDPSQPPNRLPRQNRTIGRFSRLLVAVKRGAAVQTRPLDFSGRQELKDCIVRQGSEIFGKCTPSLCPV
jgi:hypothetical protein